MEQPDIEKEVKRLFRTDSEAISVKWELITEDDKNGPEKGDTSGAPGASGGFSRTDTAASLDIGKFPFTSVAKRTVIYLIFKYVPLKEPWFYFASVNESDVE